MEHHNIPVFGVYGSRDQARRGVDQLTAAGFQKKDISLLFPDRRDSIGHCQEENPEALDSAGAIPAIVTSDTLWLLVGASAIAVPGLGPLIAAGPIADWLKGTKFGPEGLVGCLVAMGMPELEAKRYESRVRAGIGGVLLWLQCSSDQLSAARIVLMESGAEDVSAPGEHVFSTDVGET